MVASVILPSFDVAVVVVASSDVATTVVSRSPMTYIIDGSNIDDHRTIKWLQSFWTNEWLQH
jgi:hypothetical protein